MFFVLDVDVEQLFDVPRPYVPRVPRGDFMAKHIHRFIDAPWMVRPHHHDTSRW